MTQDPGPPGLCLAQARGAHARTPGSWSSLTDQAAGLVRRHMPRIRPEPRRRASQRGRRADRGPRPPLDTTRPPPTCAPASSRASSSQPKISAAEDPFKQYNHPKPNNTKQPVLLFTSSRRRSRAGPWAGGGGGGPQQGSPSSSSPLPRGSWRAIEPRTLSSVAHVRRAAETRRKGASAGVRSTAARVRAASRDGAPRRRRVLGIAAVVGRVAHLAAVASRAEQAAGRSGGTASGRVRAREISSARVGHTSRARRSARSISLRGRTSTAGAPRGS